MPPGAPPGLRLPPDELRPPDVKRPVDEVGGRHVLPSLEARALGKLAREEDGVRDQRPAGECPDVLPGNALRASPRRDHGEDLRLAPHGYATLSSRRLPSARRAASHTASARTPSSTGVSRGSI